MSSRLKKTSQQTLLSKLYRIANYSIIKMFIAVIAYSTIIHYWHIDPNILVILLQHAA